jgi:hypothetical protein
MRRRVHLFRCWRHTQLDVEWRGGFLSLGLDRHGPWRPIAYWSPDATPVHPLARGLKAR